MNKKLKNNDVLNHFFSHKSGVSHTSNLSTCGKSLYSYDLEIARVDCNGDFVVFDYTAPSGHFCSVTTSQHVGMAKRKAPKQRTTIMRPDVAVEGGLINPWGNR